MERYYCFAGLEFAVSMPDEIMYTDQFKLESFETDQVKQPHRFYFEKVNELTEPEGKCITVQPNFRIYEDREKRVRYIGAVQQTWEHAYIRAVHKEKEHFVQLRMKEYAGRVGTNAVLEAMEIEHLIARSHGFLFHCSYISYKGKAILFTAPSETGKSTQADLWEEYRGAEIVNGDRAAVRIVNDEVMAEGIPFSGSSRYCKNRSLPVAAVVYLGQAPQTTIRRVRGYEAFFKVWEGISVNTWDRKDMELVSDAVKQLVEKVPVFHMPCTPDEAAVTALEQVLMKMKIL